MTEILWHGRGGQGAFTAARLLGAAYALHEGRYALAFPSFGPERRGAPIRAFTKLDARPIGDRSEIEKADFSIFLDDTLFGEQAFSQLKPNGKILLNTKRHWEDPKIVFLNAEAIALEILGLSITNTVMLGAFSAVFDGITSDDIVEVIHENMPKKLQEKNIAAALAARRAILQEK